MIIKKITIACTAFALLLSSFAPAAFASEYNYGNDRLQNIITSNSLGINQHLSVYGRLFTFMEGEQEVPGPGDPDGIGIARMSINSNEGQVCVNMRVYFIEPATAAHIHEGEVGEAGPVVVAIPTTDSQGRAQGCVNIDSTKANDILSNPTGYYINIHNSAYPDGAVRGQL